MATNMGWELLKLLCGGLVGAAIGFLLFDTFWAFIGIGALFSMVISFERFSMMLDAVTKVLKIYG